MTISTKLAGAALLVLAATTATTPAADAAAALHLSVPEDYDAAEHFDAGEQLCVDWAGTFHEVRHGGYDLVVPPGGQVPGEAHINGAVDGYVELVPDDPGLPSYAGTYREKVDGVLVGTDAGGSDILRVAHYGLTSILRGTDGSALRLSLSGKVTLDAKGRAVVSRDTYSCR